MTQVVISNKADEERREFFENLTPQAFKDLGADRLAYVKPITVDNRPGYAVYSANGNLIAVQNTPQMAQTLIFENEMAAVTIH